jgi:hypothetical protein
MAQDGVALLPHLPLKFKDALSAFLKVKPLKKDKRKRKR